MLAAALLVVVLGGTTALLIIKKRAAAAGEGLEEGVDPVVAEIEKKPRREGPPTFVPLDPFVVNLADKGSDRFAQIAITLQIDDPKFADQIKLYMPAIRNNILMVLANKTSEELLTRAGKEALAAEIRREAVRPMGIEMGADGNPTSDSVLDHNPVEQVQFANFIIQ
jgi:flagellar FliL protein